MPTDAAACAAAEVVQWPPFDFPPAEDAALRAAYAAAEVILEYGSGGSTVHAASLPGKRVFSVESDRVWALRMQCRIDEDDLPGLVTVLHTDIGPTGKWGRPTNPAAWPRFPSYVLDVWSEPFMRHPDVVLIDGRFRAACMMGVLALIRHPVRVLFDDYADRRPYHVVEEFIQPVEMAGRMAVFDATPGLISVGDIHQTLSAFTQVTYAERAAHYDQPAAEAVVRRFLNMDKKK